MHINTLDTVLSMDTNNTHDNIKQRHDAMWSRSLLQQELRQLKREQEHLKSKAHERDLTIWEVTRMERIADEVMNLLSEFTKTINSERSGKAS